jgi:hypothetical protein
MKTRRSAASVPTRSSSRLRAQTSACVSAPRPAHVPAHIDARQLIDSPSGASLRTLHNAKGQFSRAGMNTVGQISCLWKKTAVSFSEARMKARKHISRAWRNASELLSNAGMNAKGMISRSWKYIRAQQVVRSNSKRLQVAETISLGEKRFVAVIRVDGREFLVGGGATNVALLTQLDAKQSFDNLLTETMNVPKKRPAKRARKQIVMPPIGQVGGQV